MKVSRPRPRPTICFGNQILGRALGLDTFKMKFGHRGINVPVRNHLTGKIDLTSQNHGFGAVSEKVSVDEVDAAYDRVVAGDVKFRFVIDTETFPA